MQVTFTLDLSDRAAVEAVIDMLSLHVTEDPEPEILDGRKVGMPDLLHRIEYSLLTMASRTTGGSPKKMSQALNIPERTLYRLLDAHHLTRIRKPDGAERG